MTRVIERLRKQEKKLLLEKGDISEVENLIL